MPCKLAATRQAVRLDYACNPCDGSQAVTSLARRPTSIPRCPGRYVGRSSGLYEEHRTSYSEHRWRNRQSDSRRTCDAISDLPWYARRLIRVPVGYDPYCRGRSTQSASLSNDSRCLQSYRRRRTGRSDSIGKCDFPHASPREIRKRCTSPRVDASIEFD